MAANVQISIKDRNSATSWLESINQINQEYNTAMQEAANSLSDMKNAGEGTVVDEFVKVGDQLLTAAQQTFEAISAIAETVNTVLDLAGDFVDGAKGVIEGIFNKLF